MTIDTRTDAEKRYDATRLSRAPIVDPWEPIIETLLDATIRAAPELPPDQPLSRAEEIIITMLLALDGGE